MDLKLEKDNVWYWLRCKVCFCPKEVLNIVVELNSLGDNYKTLVLQLFVALFLGARMKFDYIYESLCYHIER